MSQRVLSVDDSQDVRWALGRLVQAQGWKPVVEKTGLEALAALRHKLADVVLLDMRLPDIKGSEVPAEIKKCDAAIPVIIITTKNWQQQR